MVNGFFLCFDFLFHFLFVSFLVEIHKIQPNMDLKNYVGSLQRVCTEAYAKTKINI